MLLLWCNLSKSNKMKIKEFLKNIKVTELVLIMYFFFLFDFVITIISLNKYSWVIEQNEIVSYLLSLDYGMFYWIIFSLFILFIISYIVKGLQTFLEEEDKWLATFTLILTIGLLELSGVLNNLIVIGVI